MNLEELKEKLRRYSKKDIIITNHADIRTFIREINLEEVKENITNPEKLVHAVQKKARKPNEEKYECYFAYSKTHAHKYVIIINRKVIIVTIININRDWQRGLK